MASLRGGHTDPPLQYSWWVEVVDMHVVLISTYELGRQPFGLASPAAWLRAAGAKVTCIDLAVEALPEAAIRTATMVAFYLPMHTATRMAAATIRQVRGLNPQVHLVAYGLYAPLNAEYLHSLGVATLIGAEFEERLVREAHRGQGSDVREEDSGVRSQDGQTPTPDHSTLTTQPRPLNPDHRPLIPRLAFLTPDRSGLPALTSYAQLRTVDGDRVVGYTEASRGCKHTCRHCPVVPVYGGQFRVVPQDVVLADIRQQVAAGAQHITFGDPDFFNGPGHAIPIVTALHAEFPQVTFDVTIKIEHLLRHAKLLPTLRENGCSFVISAVESCDDAVLARLEKHHTRDDFVCAVQLMREVGLPLSPTFVTFTPWTTRATYCDLLALIAELDVIEHVAPVQYAIRLLIPAGSLLMELSEVQQLVGSFDAQLLCYPWQHPNPMMDGLYQQIRRVVQRKAPRQEIFAAVWQLAHQSPAPENLFSLASRPIPYLTEPWYC
jgi:radical SAM superfamily enzyme YgiQ (UPF0313 family)